MSYHPLMSMNNFGQMDSLVLVYVCWLDMRVAEQAKILKSNFFFSIDFDVAEEKNIVVNLKFVYSNMMFKALFPDERNKIAI